MKRTLLVFLSTFLFTIPSMEAQIAAAKLDKGSQQATVEDIIIVFKMHFDIGYTDWAESVLQKYTTSMIHETLHSVEITDSLPLSEQFIWTLPGWPMKYILENTGSEIKTKVEDALRSGRFRVHALPFVYETESSDLETLVRGMSYSSQINRKYNQPLARGAKLTDVPSHSWVLPTLLTHSGVKFLHIGCNSGSTSPDVPTLFWWEGPDGSRLLTFNWAEYYGSGILPPANWKYKTWLAMIHTHENTGAPRPEDVAAILKEAREKAPGARIRIGQLEDFYDALMKENPSIPVVKGDMPDTWIHGYMSMPKSVKINKSMQRLIYNEETLNTLLSCWNVAVEPVKPHVAEAIEGTLLFDEHTFGLAMSHGHQAEWAYADEFAVNRARGMYDYIETSWDEKESRVRKAQQSLVPSLRKDLKNLADAVQLDGRKVIVYNPLPWKRSGVVQLSMGIYGKNFQVYALKDATTNEIIPAYNDRNNLSFYAGDVPSLGYKAYSVIDSPVSEAVPCVSVDETNSILENDCFKITINQENGSLLSVWDKKQQKEMVDKNSEYGFGEYIHEKFGMEEISRYNSSYVKEGQHGWADQEMARPADTGLKYRMIKGKSLRIKYEQTPFSASATSFCHTNAGDDYTITYTLYNNTPCLEICWGIQGKTADPQPEGGWLAFPFNVTDASFRLGRTGGVVNPAKDFVGNTNRDYFFLNTGLAVIDKNNGGFGLSTPDAPGVSLDRPGLFRFTGDFVPRKPNVFVNLFNNQWGTNFAEWIDGSFSAKVYVWPVSRYTNETSLIRPTEETRVPLMGVYAEGKNGGSLPVSKEGLALSRKGILVTAFGPNTDGDGFVLRLWEQCGEGGKCDVILPRGSFGSAQLCTLRGEPLGGPFLVENDKLTLDVGAYQPVSVLLKEHK